MADFSDKIVYPDYSESRQFKYIEIAKEARKTVLRLIYKAQVSHIGSNFSCIDIMTAIFDFIDLDKDKFILSKGWAAASLYYFLWRKGKITEEELNSFCMPGSKFIGLAEPMSREVKCLDCNGTGFDKRIKSE